MIGLNSFLWNAKFIFYYTSVRPQCDFSILGRIHPGLGGWLEIIKRQQQQQQQLREVHLCLLKTRVGSRRISVIRLFPYICIGSRSHDFLCKPINKDAIVIDFPPQEVTEDCSLWKVYGKDFSQRPDAQMSVWKSRRHSFSEEHTRLSERVRSMRMASCRGGKWKIHFTYTEVEWSKNI